MDIIKPNSSYPSLHDGLHIYSGYSNIAVSTEIKTVMITTDLRQAFFVKFEAILAAGIGAVPSYEQQCKQLGYYEETDILRGTLNFTVKVPYLHQLRYFIVGSDEVKTITNSELSTSSATVFPNVLQITGKFVHADVSSNITVYPALLDLTTIALTNPATGKYRLTASTAIFNTTKTIVLANLYGELSHANDSLIVRPNVNSTTILDFFVKGDGGADVALGTAGVMFMSITNY